MDNPLVDLKGLSEPITKLVEVVSKGIGTLYAPFGTVRQAKADAKSKTILAEADAKILNIEDRAQKRLMYKESQRQENIEAITSKSALELDDKVSDKEVDQDWVTQFFGHAQDIYDQDLQILWARILAGEVSSPGKYSKRTLQFLKSFDKWEAELFTGICSFALRDNGGWHFLFLDDLTFVEAKKIYGNADWLSHFRSIGLLSPQGGSPTASKLNDRKVSYHKTQYILKGRDTHEKGGGIQLLEMPCSTNTFTQIGHQLAMISGAEPIDGYIDKLSLSLKKQKVDLGFQFLESDE